MAVLKDYKCKVHGYFEAWGPECPHGCTGETVQVVFLTPVATMSDKTKHTHQITRQMAESMGRSDIKPPMEGLPQPSLYNHDPKSNPLACSWSGIEGLGRYNMNSIMGESAGLSLKPGDGLHQNLVLPRPAQMLRHSEDMKK